MYNTQITVAGITVNVEHRFGHFVSFAEKFISHSNTCDFSVCISDEDIENERVFVKKQCEKEKTIPIRISDVLLEETAIYRKIADNLSKYHAIVFHGSAVAVGNKAVIFSAPSGTGKTTHTRLWLKNIKNSFVVDGDKPIIRVFDNNIWVCGTPWNGKEHMGENIRIPLIAVCQVNRSGSNRIEKTTPTEYLPHFLEQTHRPDRPTAIAENLPVIKEIAESISFYNLYCNMDDSASFVSYNAIMG